MTPSLTSPTIPLPASHLSSHPQILSNSTQKSLVSALTTLPSTTSIPNQTSLHDLSSLLTDSLARTGWTDRVRSLALELLNSGQCASFVDLLREVERRAKIPRDTSTIGSGDVDGGRAGKEVNGTNGAVGSGTSTPTQSQQNGSATTSATGTQSQTQTQTQSQSQPISIREGWFGPDGLPDVRIPIATVEVGVEYLKTRLKECVEVVGDGEVEDSSDDE